MFPFQSNSCDATVMCIFKKLALLKMKWILFDTA